MNAVKRFRATIDRNLRAFSRVKPFFAAWPYSIAEEAFPTGGSELQCVANSSAKCRIE